MRTLITADPFADRLHRGSWEQRGTWPANWIGPYEPVAPPWVAAFRLRFTLETARTVRLHVSADERYELWLDGARIGRGPERGDGRPWFFETYDLALHAGAHTLVALVWAVGERAPVAQHSLRPGFLLCPEEDADRGTFATGHAPWEVKLIGGYQWTPPLAAFGVGHNIDLDLRQFAHGFERGEGANWLPPRALHPGFSAAQYNQVYPHEHLLAPALLPPMLEAERQIGRVRNIAAPALGETHSLPVRAADHLPNEEAEWQGLLGGGSLTVPANTRRRVIIDLENYYCAYPELIVSGGDAATVRLNWQESLFVDTTWNKGNRDEVENKLFTTMWWHRDGIGDRWTLDGGQKRRLATLWWQSGRYVEMLVETSNTPLVIERLFFRETRYPLENEAAFAASDERLAQVTPIATRALQMCAHETYMDCPYFEQLMYIGDTRIECLLTYTISPDDRLPRKALAMFDASRMPNGLTQSRYPTRQRQIIPPFSLWYVAMLHDFLMYRGDMPLVKKLLPGARGVIDHFTALRGEDGLVRSPVGWNYVDWVTAWPSGEPPGAKPGEVCAPINWQYVYSLRKLAEIEAFCGERELAARADRLANQTVAALTDRFWNASRGLYADDANHEIFTEHSQCLAILSGALPEQQRQTIPQNVFGATNLTQPTVYFMHYFFETCRELGRMDVFLQRMPFWFQQVELGFKTTYENGTPFTTRSDCHAWGAHPLFHYFGSLLGIRPAAAGFRAVEFKPQLGGLSHISGTMLHPAGHIHAEVREENGELHGSITLPVGVAGTLHVNNRSTALNSGENSF